MARTRIIKQRTGLARRIDPNWSRWMKMVRQVPEIRSEKVRRTRQLLADADLDSDDVLDITVDRLLDDLGVALRKPDEETDRS